MKNLPIGIQTLSEIRVLNGVYVDKTELVHQLVTQGKYYFFSRPRRFGKSLLVSTLKSLFLGKKQLFEDLWIEDKWDWSKTNPVIHISFDAVSYTEISLYDGLKSTLHNIAKEYKVKLLSADLKDLFNELIEKLAQKHGKIVILIDEYDKPIIDYLEDNTLEKAKINRLILRDFYSVLKNADEYLRLVFITGISKFSKVSIFSHLNNLDDITLHPDYATLTGYTQSELVHYFADYLQLIATKMNITQEALLEKMRIWYNGYSWDGESRVYNPFGTLNFLSKKIFRNYWFATGSPNFLIQQMRKHNQFRIENSIISTRVLDKYDLENIGLVALLFQTGYLTIKEIDEITGDLILDYPNNEVRESMYEFLIDDVAQNSLRMNTGRTIQDINKAFLARDLSKVSEILKAILADLPPQTFEKQSEGLYHGLVHLIFSYLGMFIHSEVQSSQGRADAVVQTLTDVYIFEFKFNKTAQAGLEQIKKQRYADKYRALGKQITGIGVNFDGKEREMNEWIEEIL